MYKMQATQAHLPRSFKENMVCLFFCSDAQLFLNLYDPINIISPRPSVSNGFFEFL